MASVLMSWELEALESRQHLSAAPDVSADARRLIFTAVQGAASRPQWVSLSNEGRATLALKSVGLTGDDAGQFRVRRKGLPATLAPGRSVRVRVGFSPTSAAVRSARLEVRTNDRDQPTLAVALRGLGTAGRFDAAEPSLQRVLDTLEIPVNVGDADPATNALDGPVGGEETAMPLLRKAGPGPVRITVAAAFTWDGNDPVARIGWYRPEGDRDKRQLLTLPPGTEQSLLPTANGTRTFDPKSDTFGLYAQWPSEAHAGAFTEDAMNRWDKGPTRGHVVRLYPCRTAAGQLVPGKYVVAMEQAANRDYQDLVLIVENVMPYDAPLAPHDLRVTSAKPGAVKLAWSDVSDNETSFVIERSRRKTGVFDVVGSTGAGATTFTDKGVSAGQRYFYRVRAVNKARSSDASNRAATTIPVAAAPR